MMTRMFLRYIGVFLLQANAISAEASFGDSARNRRWYLPHYVPLQFAGNIGFLSTGVGYKSNKENYELNILYGYVPTSIGDQTIHMITAKNMFPLARYLTWNNQTIIPYLGLGLVIEVSGHAFFTLPSHYPKGYYDFPKNLHVTGFAGVKLKYLFEDDNTFLRGLEFYAEAGTIDLYIWYKFISNEIKLNEIFGLAVGVNFLLDH
jgi:hypothetical protein